MTDILHTTIARAASTSPVTNENAHGTVSRNEGTYVIWMREQETPYQIFLPEYQG